LKYINIDGPLLKKMILFAAKNLENNKKIVNDLNVFPVPDGDTGTNMALTIQFAAKEVSKLQSNDLSKVADAASSGSLMGARGNSGVILSQLFRGFAKACKNKNILDIKDLSIALQSGAEMAYKAVMKPTEGTMLTVAREGAKYALDNYTKHETLEAFLEGVIHQCNSTLKQTPNMLPVLKEAGVVDAGGKGLIYILEGAYKALFEQDIADIGIEQYDQGSAVNMQELSTADIQYAYCTEFMILTPNAPTNKLKEILSSMGDSLLVVGDEDRIKVHIHTNNPGHAIELALKHGELTNIKIDNMKEQHRRQMDYQQEGNIEESNTNKEIESLEYAFIAVVSGEGIEQIYKDLGVTSTIKGGQTMNPSTEDFLNEINKINANQIYILPNNSNILLAANQAKKISNKKIEVIPSKTIPQGISALLAFSPEEAHKDNLQNMHNAIKDVKTGQITFAVRDTQVNNIKIETDDIIGIYDGNIIVAGKDINDVALQLINEMVDEEDELITIFSGEEVSKEQVAQLQSKVENSYADVDLEVHYGGQPLYYYIIAVE